MFGTDHMFGSFDFQTELSQDAEGMWTAKALGIEVKNRDRDQAVNDLNKTLDEKLIKGEIRPQM